ncbi:MAG TPA: choice-of-anchor V domain-containing protein, partial [Bryobacteraceae bacterium]
MDSKRKLFWGKAAVVLSAIPVLIYAESSGPQPGLSGVPNEAGTCTACHGTGKANINGGSVAVTFPNGQTYTPGLKQHLVVTVADPTAKRWGFQTAARQAGSTSTIAGGFTSTDANTQVICSNNRFNGSQRTTSGACPSATPFMYVEHTLAGTRLGTTGSVNFEFDWTPPASDVGSIIFYVAANAANGNNNDDSGDHVYTANYTLTSAAATTNAPAISDNGVLNGASFAPLIEAGSWVAIQGKNFSTASNCDPVANPQPGCRTWSSSDFVNGTPTSLDGVSVSIGGKPAYVYFVSPTQINVQAPDVGTGTVAVTVTNSQGTSNSVSVTADSFSPGFFAAGTYAIATHADGTLVAPAGTFPGSKPAAKGETVTLWGTGFGPVSPSVPAGLTSAQA